MKKNGDGNTGVILVAMIVIIVQVCLLDCPI